MNLEKELKQKIADQEAIMALCRQQIIDLQAMLDYLEANGVEDSNVGASRIKVHKPPVLKLLDLGRNYVLFDGEVSNEQSTASLTMTYADMLALREKHRQEGERVNSIRGKKIPFEFEGKEAEAYVAGIRSHANEITLTLITDLNLYANE